MQLLEIPNEQTCPGLGTALASADNANNLSYLPQILQFFDFHLDTIRPTFIPFSFVFGVPLLSYSSVFSLRGLSFLPWGFLDTYVDIFWKGGFINSYLYSLRKFDIFTCIGWVLSFRIQVG